MMVPLSQSMKRLTILWFLGAGVVCLIVLVQTLTGHYGDKARDAWAWLFPAVLPTLTLIVTVWSAEARGTAKSGVVDSFVFWLAFALSLTYLSVIVLTILLQPLLSASPQGYLDIMHGSSFHRAISSSRKRLARSFLREERVRRCTRVGCSPVRVTNSLVLSSSSLRKDVEHESVSSLCPAPLC